MEAASRAVRSMLEALAEQKSADDALIKFARQLEEDYEAAQDIQLYIFGLRCFFAWPRAAELLEHPEAVQRIQTYWIEQNDVTYTKWLASFNDDPEVLKWSKWTFQAKTTLLAEFVKGKE